MYRYIYIERERDLFADVKSYMFVIEMYDFTFLHKSMYKSNQNV